MRWKGQKGKAWDAFSRYLRFRDYYVCITCGREGEQGMQAGHFIPLGLTGSNSALGWDERNVNAQCAKCNGPLGGWGERYLEQLLARIGERHVNELRAMRWETSPKHPPWEEMTQRYIDKLQLLVEVREENPFFFPRYCKDFGQTEMKVPYD